MLVGYNSAKIAMDATTSALLRELVGKLSPLSSLDDPYLLSPSFWTLVISSTIGLISSVIALLIAGGVGEYIKPWLGFKSSLELLSFRRYKQASHYWRLAIRNSGREVARSVQVDILKIVDDGGKERDNFLPIPLRWTHLNCESRDILSNQTVYLDVIEHIPSAMENAARLITRFGGGVDDFEKLKNGESHIVLGIYQMNGKFIESSIDISWPTGMFFDTRLKGKKWHLTKNGEFIGQTQVHLR